MTSSLLSLVLSLFVLPVFCQSPAERVNLFMGVRGGSNCVIGPQVPHGSINPSPQTPQGGQGAYKEGQPVRGFAQLHVSGTGWGRYGQLLLSPQRGFTPVENAHDSEIADEQAAPFYYRARLARYNILCEVTPTHHCAAYRFTYGEAPGAPSLLFDVAHSLSRHIVPEQHGEFLGGDISYDPRTQTLTGWGEYTGGFGSAEPYRVFFALASPDFDLQRAEIGATPIASPSSAGNLGSAIAGNADWSLQEQPSALFAKILPYRADDAPKALFIAVSLRSVNNARQFLNDETRGRGFDGIARAAKEQWDATLSKIEIDGSDADKELFYTTLYHSFVMPRDRENENPRFMGENIDDHYCIWDTWRTLYPLLTLVDEPFVAKTIRSFIRRYQEDGKCTPTFTSSLEWDWRQGGDDVENVIADAIVKNVGGFDRREAYRWLRWSALNNRSREYQQLGWQPEVDTLMSCSNAVEYAYNDFCVSQAARALGDKAFARQMLQRSHSWQQIFNREQKDDATDFRGFIVPRRKDGSWCANSDDGFSPRHGYGSWQPHFYEGNSWTYSLFTPHDFPALIAICGGKQTMVERLRYGFDNGLIALWNEPGFLSPFIFHHCDRPDLTAEYVERLRRTNFSIDRGYCDNEDSGAMGSWYVFTTLGLFPNAGQDFYYLLPPTHSSTWHLSNGRTLRIMRSGSGSTLRRVTFRGRRLRNHTIRHRDLLKGGTLRFEMAE